MSVSRRRPSLRKERKGMSLVGDGRRKRKKGAQNDLLYVFKQRKVWLNGV